ncbi:50S ribosomal protein L10 [Cyclobacterium qasimii]|uniref:Large ribosomal subunit protein uL10 n=2 Tax=Cyclobacterium qasimii TaxID=1350429 RepID=S7WPW2_9BACT|nr:50S ribosomal protein L10 [Cyclobacterium qasimii]EPR68794.1 LSU ribosomal protein L10p (P0) [Cyclobacterium qasimii M12-11B]GEO22636.1 50S ribosomal protein L10 [Cyclobacterium qasimii]
MTRENKKSIIDELTEKLKSTPHFYIADASGFSVAQVNGFRKMCFDKGLEYKVYKNTLIRKALENLETDYSEFAENALKGFSGILFSSEVGNLPAKVIIDYRKKVATKDKKPWFKGASIEGAQFLGEENLEMLSKLKSREELIGEVISLLQSPATNVVSALQSGKNILAGLVKTLAEKEEA